MTDKHKRITQAQFDIWINDPTTKTYLQCLKWSAEQMAEVIGNGGFIDSSNNDITVNQLYDSLGIKSGLLQAADPKPILTIHQLLEEEEEEND